MAAWNHNIHYHPVMLGAVPVGCGRALDVGCGEGVLTRKLAGCCEEVTGIDVSANEFLRGDVMNYPLEEGSFDFISAVAVLHHLPLRAGLARLRTLLRPGGVIAILGLYRLETVPDYAWAGVAVPLSHVLRLMHGYSEVGSALSEPRETLREIRAACDEIVPGGDFQRRLLFRYSFIGRKAPV